MNRQLIVVIFILFVASCKFKSGTKVIIYTRAPLKSHLYIKHVPFFSGKETVVDSAIIKDNHDSLTLFIPETDGEQLYSIAGPNNRLAINIINDSKLIRLRVDYFADTCNIEGSVASVNLKKFENEQLHYADRTRNIGKQIDSLTKIHQKGKLTDSLTKAYDRRFNDFYAVYRDFADTVKSPAAFMKVFNIIEFGKDFTGLKKFILTNAKRFPNHKPMQELKRQTLAMIRIFEEELQIGQQMPSISLPDKNGKYFNTASLKGQYYLMDLWSTWCPQCYAFKNAEYHLYKAEPKVPVRFIGVAVDDNIDTWKSSIKQFVHPTTELIDTKMWQGPAVNTLLFDSIPFNFLVNPQGKIIAKAIKPDSLAKVISSLIKK